MKRLFICAATLLMAANAFAQSLIPNSPGRKETVAIRNATIYPVTSAPIEHGTIVFANGIITAIGTDVAIPANAKVIDAAGLSVYPGMIDSGSVVGLTEISSEAGTVDTTELGELNPNARAATAINPHSNLIPVTRGNGVTAVVATPRGGIVSGQSALIQLEGWTPAEMLLVPSAAMNIRFPRVRSVTPESGSDEDAEKKSRESYSKEVDQLRDLFRDAQAYARAAAAREKNPGTRRFDRDVMLEALVPVVEGRMPVVMHANLERDIRAAFRFADEFKLSMILAGAQDVARVIPELKARKIPVILGPILELPAREDDAYDLLFSNASVLEEAGVLFSIQTNDDHNTRNLPYHAAACVAFGLSQEAALRAITINPAKIFGVADRIGSLEVGKMATLFISDGTPLEVRSNVKRLYIAGEEISLESLHTKLYEKFSQRPK
jgi:imidazolonepropionase-like amidohydrolase